VGLVVLKHPCSRRLSVMPSRHLGTRPIPPVQFQHNQDGQCTAGLSLPSPSGDSLLDCKPVRRGTVNHPGLVLPCGAGHPGDGLLLFLGLPLRQFAA
jgi:hypothetical protein